jgi:hypothetical protein
MPEDVPIRVIITGDRNWTDEGVMMIFLSNLPKGSVIIHGGCKGADIIAGRIATELGLKVIVYDADWDDFGPAAGPIRNRFMLSDGEPDLVAAFHDDLPNSKGTMDMVVVANMANVPVFHFKTTEDNDFFDVE